MSIIVIINHQIKRGDGDHNHFDDGDMMMIRMIIQMGITYNFPFLVFFGKYAFCVLQKRPKTGLFALRMLYFPLIGVFANREQILGL